MQEINFGNKDRYIKLSGGSRKLSGRRGFNVFPESRSVQLSGSKWKWVWNRPVGVILQKGSEQVRVPIIDLTRYIQVLLYGLSVIFVSLGFLNILGNRKGEGYG
jgi:hypothetical protein